MEQCYAAEDEMHAATAGNAQLAQKALARMEGFSAADFSYLGGNPMENSTTHVPHRHSKLVNAAVRYLSYHITEKSTFR